MILGYRAEYLAKASTDHSKPILVLCYNEPLAVKLAAIMDAKGLSDRVHVRNFHKWCRQQLVAYGQNLPRQGPDMFDEMVDFVIRAVEHKQIPSGQYMAVMIDEGHDFAPEWLKLVTQMVDPTTNSLLLLYDNAQAIYKKNQKTLKFTLKSVGINAVGRNRTTILKVNYRNTRQILQVASMFAGELLKATNDDVDTDDSPTVTPVGCGRDGAPPLVIRLPTLNAEAAEIAERLSQAHQEGFAWSDMAIICRNYNVMDVCAYALERKRLPHQVRRKSGSFNPGSDTIKIMTMHVSKGLEFPIVALPGIGQLPTQGEDEQAEAQLFYVASTRATSQLILTSCADSKFSLRLSEA
jgi:superfamily I DNA/RNA helicase